MPEPASLRGHLGARPGADPKDRLSYARALLVLTVGASSDSQRRIGEVILILAETETRLFAMGGSNG